MLIAHAVLLLQSQPTQAEPPSRRERFYTASDLIHDVESIVVRFDCYYAIELMIDDGERDFLSEKVVEQPNIDKYNTLAEAILDCEKRCPALKIFIDPAIPTVVHVVDRRLDRAKRYVLDDKPKRAGKGSLYQYLEELAKQDTRVYMPNAWAIGEPPLEKLPMYVHPVLVNPGERSLREVLVLYATLSQCNPRLFYAFTDQEDGVWRTQFQCGHRSPEVSLARPAVLDFGTGRSGYCRSRGRPDASSAAIEFIGRRLYAKEPLNVRWAMFALGRDKAEEGVDILLKYIDYQYTTSKLLGESYPAVLALTQIGKPAAEAALKQIGSEPIPLRARLMGHVVRNVLGVTPGDAALRAAGDQASDGETKARYEIARKPLEYDN